MYFSCCWTIELQREDVCLKSWKSDIEVQKGRERLWKEPRVLSHQPAISFLEIDMSSHQNTQIMGKPRSRFEIQGKQEEMKGRREEVEWTLQPVRGDEGNGEEIAWL